MKIVLSVLLRIALFISLGLIVFDYLRTKQLFILMEKGYIDDFSTTIVTWPGTLFIIVFCLLLIIQIVQFTRVMKNKKSVLNAYFTTEYDVSDERAVQNTQKSVSLAFSIILTYSFIILGSYMFIPNYFLDHIWYPLFTTASIPIIGLIVYITTYKVLEYK